MATETMGEPMIMGAVLAGGRSSRFGSDKAKALFGGRPLIAHAKAAIAPFVDRIVIVGGGGSDALADLPEADLGPLGGIAAALDHAAAIGAASVVTIACDMPRVPDGLIPALLRRAPAYSDGAPVLGHWPSALGAQLLAWLERDERRAVRGWAQAIGALPIESSGRIENVNTPADLLAL